MVDPHRHLRWHEETRTRVAGYGLFDIYTSRRRTEADHDAEFLLVDAPDWVTVVPFDEATQSFLMVRQFRHGSGTVTLEFPAGVVHRGEPPETAAAREFREETGCTAQDLTLLGAANPNPAFMTNRVHTYVTADFTRTDELTLDENEILDVETVPIGSIIEGLGSGEFTNAIMIVSLTWFLRWQNRICAAGGSATEL